VQNNPLGRIDPDGKLDNNSTWLRKKIWGSDAASVYEGESKEGDEKKDKKQDEKKQEKNRFTMTQAKTHYQFGGGIPIHLHLSSIDLSKVTLADFNERGLAIIKLDSKHFSNMDDAVVHGTITLQLLNENKAKIALNSGRDNLELKGLPAGMFNFEMQSWREPLNWIRNSATLMGELIYGTRALGGNIIIYTGGIPFPIYYHGTITIPK
jgi:hypothetical protein